MRAYTTLVDSVACCFVSLERLLARSRSASPLNLIAARVIALAAQLTRTISARDGSFLTAHHFWRGSNIVRVAIVSQRRRALYA